MRNNRFRLLSSDLEELFGGENIAYMAQYVFQDLLPYKFWYGNGIYRVVLEVDIFSSGELTVTHLTTDLISTQIAGYTFTTKNLD